MSPTLPVVRRTTIPPMKNASKTVSSGATRPPAFWRMPVPLREVRPSEPLGRLGSCGGSPRVAQAARSFCAPPVIASPSSSSLAVGGNSPTIAALEEDEDAIGEREDLLELERDEQDAATLVALLDETAMDEFDRPDVEAPRRLGRDQDPRVASRSLSRG